MILEARVTHSTGRTRHAVLTRAGATALPHPARVRIEPLDGGWYLFYFDADGTCLTDTWHQTLDAAKAQAAFEFGDLEWTQVDLQ